MTIPAAGGLQEPDRWRPEVHLATGTGRSALGSLAPALKDVGFTEETSCRALGADDGRDLLCNAALYALWSHSGVEEMVTTAAGVVVQLLVRNGNVSSSCYRCALSGSLRRLLSSLDLVVDDGAVVSSRVSVSPWRSEFFISDPLFRVAGTANGTPTVRMCDRRGLVMPPHASSFALADRIEPVDGVLLDIGSGCGVLGITLADRYRSVICADINPRAVAYSEANGLVNGRALLPSLVDVTAGPWQGVTGDHVLFNTPTGPSYRSDRTEVGWMSARRALSVAGGMLPTALNHGGLAQVFVIVEVPEPWESASAVVHSWLEVAQSRHSIRVVEWADPLLGLSAKDIERGVVGPGCVLVGGKEESDQLLRHLRARGIREVVPAVVSIRL